MKGELLIKDSGQHALVRAVASAALNHGMKQDSKEFREFYEDLAKIVKNFEEHRTELIEYLTAQMVDAVNARPSAFIERKCKP